MSPPATAGSPIIRAATATDHAAVTDLLMAAELPVMGLSRTLDHFLLAEVGGRVVGAVGLELYEPDALLRSAVVSPDLRGSGVGRDLVAGILAHAEARGVRGVYLLTTTAERYFPRFGFERIERSEAPEAVRQSDEFREACPASAAVMRRMIDRP